jgi:drug/metabolite transporter (DMT)-like permease
MIDAIILSLIILTVILNTVAQIALKAGILQIGIFSFTWSNFVPIVIKVLLTPWILLGLFTYGVSVIVWLMVLSRTPVSIAYPISSLGYIISAIAANYILGENFTSIRIIGIFIILIGVYLIAKN